MKESCLVKKPSKPLADKRMRKIESSDNPRIKRVQKILRGKAKTHFLIEGKKLLEEAIDSGVALEEVFVSAEFQRHHAALLKRVNCEVVEVPPNLMKTISDVETPQGAVAVALRPRTIEETPLSHHAGLLFSIRDPGNMGTIFRSAEAAGCDFLALTSDCADPFQPKVVRASMGSVFRLPFFEVQDPKEYLQKNKKAGVHTYGMFPKGGHNLFTTEPLYPALLLVG